MRDAIHDSGTQSVPTTVAATGQQSAREAAVSPTLAEVASFRPGSRGTPTNEPRLRVGASWAKRRPSVRLFVFTRAGLVDVAAVVAADAFVVDPNEAVDVVLAALRAFASGTDTLRTAMVRKMVVVRHSDLLYRPLAKANLPRSALTKRLFAPLVV